MLEIYRCPWVGTYGTIPHKLRICKNSILSYAKCRSENDLVLLPCCTELTKNLHHGIWQHVTFTLLPCLISFYHGRILIGTETDSLLRRLSSNPICTKTLIRKYMNSLLLCRCLMSKSHKHYNMFI